MKLFTAAQIKSWDAFTMKSQSLSNLELMERAASAAFEWIVQHYSLSHSFFVFCGPGNNGGDGLIISRKLIEEGYRIHVFVSEDAAQLPPYKDLIDHLKTLSPNRIHVLSDAKQFNLSEGVVIDALFGTGLNKPISDPYLSIIQYINENAGEVVAIDVPSGLYTDKNPEGDVIIKAKHTLTFETYKPAFLIDSSADFLGKITTLSFGLSKEFYQQNESRYEIIDEQLIQGIYRKRSPFTHKGDFGHAAILAGSYGMMGAAVLATRSCIRSGAGKVTAYIPECGYQILQTTNPEVMCRIFGEKHLEKIEMDGEFSSMGVGPGMGIEQTADILENIFEHYQGSLVLDADALNAIGKQQSLINKIPPNTILTPHPKEYERLFGKLPSGMEKYEHAVEQATKFKIIVILKGHYTFIALPDEKGYFNINGNAGMATAGSGDVLTGIITGLLAQKYAPKEAAILGTYLHGLAGSIAAIEISQEALIANDIINYLGKAWLNIHSPEVKYSS